MEALTAPTVEFTIYPESERRRTFVIPYCDGGWVIGVAGDYVLCVLDRGSIQVVVTQDDLSW